MAKDAPSCEGGFDAALRDENMMALHAQNVPLLQDMNRTVRQRVLSQKATKELCMSHLGIRPEDHRAAVAGSVALSNASLQAIKIGYSNPGTIAAPSEEILWGLEAVNVLWQEIAPTFQAAADGGAVSLDDLSMIASRIDALLSEANLVVQMYEGV
ncbi:MAG: type IV pili methyl-accepting chemotaxis transducer N-terminal domain-containing protein [Boseongicola sp.]|nr:type IV pili methyl-accepting chemotaxis transducer N-terminal domain-containing protein [Boseongicola sp.]